MSPHGVPNLHVLSDTIARVGNGDGVLQRIAYGGGSFATGNHNVFGDAEVGLGGSGVGFVGIVGILIGIDVELDQCTASAFARRDSNSPS